MKGAVAGAEEMEAEVEAMEGMEVEKMWQRTPASSKLMTYKRASHKLSMRMKFKLRKMLRLLFSCLRHSHHWACRAFDDEQCACASLTEVDHITPFLECLGPSAAKSVHCGSNKPLRYPPFWSSRGFIEMHEHLIWRLGHRSQSLRSESRNGEGKISVVES